MTTDLDPEMRVFTDRLAEAWARFAPLDTLSFPEARQVAEQVRAPWRSGGPEMARCDEGMFQTEFGPMRWRLHVPHGADEQALLVYLHGGGFTFFSIDSHDRLMREYAAASRVPVVGLDYVLSPEHKYPAALDQITAYVRAIGDGELAFDRSVRVALGGDSAGANLAVATALRLRDAGEGGQVAALLLNYGAFGCSVSDEAEARLGGPGALLNSAEMDYFWNNYLRDEADRSEPYANILAGDLRKLPPSLVVIPTCDVISEHSYAFARQARDSVTVREYPGAPHSFLEAMSIAQVARQAIADSAEWLAARLRQ